MTPFEFQRAAVTIALRPAARTAIVSDLAENPDALLAELCRETLERDRWVEQEALLGCTPATDGQ